MLDSNVSVLEGAYTMTELERIYDELAAVRASVNSLTTSINSNNIAFLQRLTAVERDALGLKLSAEKSVVNIESNILLNQQRIRILEELHQQGKGIVLFLRVAVALLGALELAHILHK